MWGRELLAYVLFLFSLVRVCLCAFICQPVHVGATREHSETLHLLVGGFHQLLCPAIQTNGLHDRWGTLTRTDKASLSLTYCTPWIGPWKNANTYTQSSAHKQMHSYITCITVFRLLMRGSCRLLACWSDNISYSYFLYTKCLQSAVGSYVLERCFEQKQSLTRWLCLFSLQFSLRMWALNLFLNSVMIKWKMIFSNQTVQAVTTKFEDEL